MLDSTGTIEKHISAREMGFSITLTEWLGVVAHRLDTNVERDVQDDQTRVA